MGKTEDLARPERILPTEPGSWYILGATRPVTLRWYDFSVGCDPVAGTRLCVDHGGVREPSPLTSFNPSLVFIAPIPTPEQLAAQAAQLAAGQELADHLRRVDAQYRSRVPDTSQREAFLAAFPPLAASTPPVEEPPSAEVIDLAAALRASMDRKGGAR